MNKISIALQEKGPNQRLFQNKMTFSSITVFYFPVKILVFPVIGNRCLLPGNMRMSIFWTDTFILQSSLMLLKLRR